MQGSSPSDSPLHQVILQKYGFLMMVPIALLVHGLVVLIPTGSPQQKAKEPEKKEEILSIGSIAQLSPGQVAPMATSASPTPKPSASTAPIVQQQSNPAAAAAPIVQQPAPQQPAQISDNSAEFQQLQQQIKDLQKKVQQQPAQPTQPEQPAPVTPPVIVSTDVISSLPGTKPCPSSKNCFLIVSQQEVQQALAQKFNTEAKPVEVTVDGDKRTVGFKLETDSKAGKTEFFYYVNTTQLHKTSEELNLDQLKNIGIDVG